MSLNQTLGSILDRVIASNPVFVGFIKLKSSGSELRSYFRESDSSQCQILIYRDKWWTKEGGTLYGELFCLVPTVQLALCGTSQSLAKPDYSVPFHHFQFGLLEHNPERSWQIHSEKNVFDFEATVEVWLTSKAIPWLTQFDSIQGVIGFMERNRRFVDLALLHATLGDAAKSIAYVQAWVSQLPRQIDKPLAKLLDAGLLSQTEHIMLSRASLQREDHYRETVKAWIYDAQPLVSRDGLHSSGSSRP